MSESVKIATDVRCGHERNSNDAAEVTKGNGICLRLERTISLLNHYS